MAILIACEFSGIVRDAFIARGHDAISCDLLPTERPGPHLQCDVRDALQRSWDMIIAHPPCQHLAVSGARWFKDKLPEQKAAIAFFLQFFLHDCPRVCVENPVGIMSSRFRKPDQYIQPWQFGHEETKKTGLWLRGLPLLKPTKIMEVRNKNLTPSGQNKLGPSPTRWMDRSRTYQGIAEAMADQWM